MLLDLLLCFSLWTLSRQGCKQKPSWLLLCRLPGHHCTCKQFLLSASGNSFHELVYRTTLLLFSVFRTSSGAAFQSIGMVSTFSTVVRKETIVGLWKGISPVRLLIITF